MPVISVGENEPLERALRRFKKKIEREGIFDFNYIKTLTDEFLADRNDTRKEIWSLFMFEMWYDRWA